MLGRFELHHSSGESGRSCFSRMFALSWLGSPCVSWQYAWQRHHVLLIGSFPLSCPASNNRFALCSCITMLPSALTGAWNGIGRVQLFPLGLMFSCSCPSTKSGISLCTCVLSQHRSAASLCLFYGMIFEQLIFMLLVAPFTIN